MDDPGGAVIIHLRGLVAQGRWDEFVSFMSTAIPFYEGPGGIRVRLLRNADDPDEFIEVIEYETEQVYAADQRRVESDTAMIAKLEEWRQLLAGPVQVDTFRDVTPPGPAPPSTTPPCTTPNPAPEE